MIWFISTACLHVLLLKNTGDFVVCPGTFPNAKGTRKQDKAAAGPTHTFFAGDDVAPRAHKSDGVDIVSNNLVNGGAVKFRVDTNQVYSSPIKLSFLFVFDMSCFITLSLTDPSRQSSHHDSPRGQMYTWRAHIC